MTDQHLPVCYALAQQGDAYIYGVEVDLDETNPPAEDCSELIQWACHRAGVTPEMPDGSWLQFRHCHKYGTDTDINTAIHTFGALLFKFSSDPLSGGRPPSSHVAMSLGDGRTMEARSTRLGVDVFSTANRGWTHAGLIPGVDYSPSKALTGTQVARAAFDQLRDVERATVAVAIAKAESAWKPRAFGDISLMTADKWGPSIGLWQIRSLWIETGNSTARDPRILTDSAQNAFAMAQISNGGTYWKPWSTYNNGTYVRFMDEARQAVASLGSSEDEMTLTPGMKSRAVADMQRQLIVIGYDLGAYRPFAQDYPPGADGDYGAKTAAAVHAFQTVEGIPVGDADAGTLALLGLAS